MKKVWKMNSREYWLGLQLIQGLGPVTHQKLLRRFGSVENIFHAKEHELSAIDNIGTKRANMLIKFDLTGKVDRELTLMSRKGINFITVEDAQYPQHLKNIFNACG